MTEPALNACTIVSKNYLPFARVLARSYTEHHPEARFFVLLVDRVDGCFEPATEPFELVDVASLGGIPDLAAFLFQYTVLEVNTAVKPFLLEHLLVEHRLERLLYLDPDILVLRRLEEVERALDQAAIVLTPHLTAPLEDDRHPDELAILRSGAYNLGFIALADRPPVRDYLAWWQSRVRDRCVVRVEEGLFVDQKWVDLVPGMFEGVRILRDPGLNVAYWNLHCRRVTMGAPPLVNGQPLAFFHFSGVEPDNLESVSKHQDRFRLADLGELRQLFERYRALLVDNGFREARSWPYAWARFDNGVAIPDCVRALYLELGEERRRFGDPFVAGPQGSFYRWLLEPVAGRGAGALPRLLVELHRSSLPLRLHFPDPLGASLPGFAEWFDVDGRRDYRLPDAFLEGLEPLLNPPHGGHSLTRPARRRLRRLLDWPPLRRFKERLKRSLGQDRWLRLKRLIMPVSAARAEAGKAARDPLAREVEDAGLARLGVNLTGYIRTESGIGEGFRCLIRALDDLDVPHSLCDVALGVASRREDPSFAEFTDRPTYPINVFGINADQVEVVGEHLGWERFAGRYNVGCWSWELDSFPARWLPAFDHFDEIWAPSSFGVGALSRVSPIPVRRMPHAVQVDEVPAADRTRFGLPADRFLFLFVFDFLSYFERKNPLALVRAFRQAFTADDRVTLVLKCANSEREPEHRAALEREIAGAPVRLLDRYLSRQEVYQLMASCDCYVSLHRSEGFGLTMAEAMCLGKPVIATAYSGNTDFMNVGNSLPVRYRLVELERDHGPYERGNRWAEPDLDHAAELMRAVVARPELGASLGQRARADVIRELGHAAVAALLKERLDDIVRRRPELTAR